VFGVLYNFYRYFLRPGKNLKQFGSWAVVTGCTDGIGKAIAELFAKKGLNIILVSRNQTKLSEIAHELEAKFKVQTKTIAVDFGSEDPNIFEAVKNGIKNLDIGILVNNVGMSYDHSEFFCNLDKDMIDKLIRINVFGTTNMTYSVLPGMIERKRGAIVNISSASSFVIDPMYCVYSGTKAYINNFSKALYYEYRDQKIHIQCQVPGFVVTKMSKIRRPSFFVCSASAFASSMAKQIGYESLIFPHWTHALQFSMLGLLPDWIIAPKLLDRGKDIRKRALKKKEQ